MINRPVLYFFVLFFVFFSYYTVTGSSSFFVIDTIIIKGLHKTNASVIYNEIGINKGDTILLKHKDEELAQIKSNILNTGLFSKVNISSNINGVLGALIIELQEIWFFYPNLIFEIGDRNFNSWWYNHNHKISRVNYGLQMEHRNISGHNDPISFVIHGGYTNKYEIDYFYPYLFHNKKFGLGAHVFYRSYKEIGFNTKNNKLQFYKADDKIYSRFRSSFYLRYRKSRIQQYFLQIGYHNNKITEHIASDINSNFFQNGDFEQKVLVINLKAEYSKLDRKTYPTKGIHFELSTKKEGINIFNNVDLWDFSIRVMKLIELNDKLSMGYALKSRINIKRDPRSYYNNIALGYSEDQIRGYDVYVIDGMDYGFVKSHLKYRIFEKTKTIFQNINISPAIQYIPFEVFGILNFDLGLVNDPYLEERSNTFVNKTLYGGGLGLHVVIYNNFTLKIEYNFNHLGESGLFWYFNTSLI